MAGGVVAVRHVPALLASAVVLLLVLGTLLAVIGHAGGAGAPSSADRAALRFTVVQAALSAGLSTALAVPVARALARRRFPGRALLIAALGAPFIMPVIVAVLGLLAIFGRAGLMNGALTAMGLQPLSIYGLQGVVLAHVFFNLPLALRLILQGWLAIPAERFRLAASLGLSSGDIARLLERPMLREVLPGVALAIFLICLTSFAVALTLGGGPRATTLELAIYQAFRFDFDLPRAAMLAVIQFGVCLAASALALGIASPSAFGAGLDRAVERWDARGKFQIAADTCVLMLTALFIMLPVASVLLSGLPHLFALPAEVWAAAARSIVVALTSVLLASGIALPLALAAAAPQRVRATAFETLGMISLAASPLVIGTGLYLMLRPVADPSALAMPVTALVNAVMAVPFALRALTPATRAVRADFGRLSDSLGICGLARLRLVTVPRLRRPLRFSAGLAGAMSMGDLGVAALFADPDRATLPVQMFRLMGAYRMDAAAGAAVLLLILSLAIFWVFDRGGQADASA
jgi:thiamine transport system permease protein